LDLSVVLDRKIMEQTFSFAKLGVGIAFLALVSLWFVPDIAQNGPETDLRVSMDNVLKSLLKQEKTVDAKQQVKIAVGYGACKDLFVDAKNVIGNLKPKGTLQNFNEIKNMDEFLEMFGYFFKHGAAAERFCPNDELFEKLVNTAYDVKDHRVALGGNAPVMARRFALGGADVLLAAKMSKSFNEDSHESIKVTGEDILDDDIHLILEYKRNEVWMDLQSPRANRFIVHSDRNNPTISSLEGFEAPLAEYKPDLLVVSGLQMMDNYPFAEGEREARLKKVMLQMQAQSLTKTRIHFEMASFVEDSLFEEITETVIPNADSLGMNEQELPNLLSMLRYGNISVMSDSNPRTAVTLDQMRDVYRVLSGNKDRPLTRLHLHTLAYQAILVTENSPWKNTRFAAAKASLTANRHVCASQKIHIDKALLLMDDSFALSAKAGSKRWTFNDERPVACWKEIVSDVPKGANPNIEICLAPNLVCAEAKQTAGCGDNISAAGLILQV